MDTPEYVQELLESNADLGQVVTVLACEVDNQVRSGENVTVIGQVLQECLPDYAVMARVLAVALRHLKPPERKAPNGDNHN
jgi:hypothetical protein